MNDTEFEQYKLSGSKLFFECGKIARGRHVPTEQRFLTLEDDNLSNVIKAAQEVSFLRGKLREWSFTEPGDNNSMFDPGILTLDMQDSFGTTPVKTSLDSISSGSSGKERIIARLVEEVRDSTSTAPCGNKEFYGFG